MITIYGTHGDSGPIKLPAANAAFEPGGVDVFDLDLPYLGCMDKVMVGHDGTGFGSGWHLDRVVVRNITRREGAVFPCALWLDKRLDGGFLTRVLDADAAREAEVSQQMRIPLPLHPHHPSNSSRSPCSLSSANRQPAPPPRPLLPRCSSPSADPPLPPHPASDYCVASFTGHAMNVL